MTSPPSATNPDQLPEATPPGDDAATAARFTDKWRARWPEWRIGQVFLPQAQREVATAWFALLQEFTDAAWTGADATPGLAKLAWWNEELIGWTKGARRHPLAPTLQRLPADWQALAASLRSLQATRDNAPGIHASNAGLERFAAAVAGVESSLFADAPLTPIASLPSPPDTAVAARVIVADLLAERALLHGDADAATRLIDDVPAAWPSAVRARRLQSTYLRHRLQQAASGAATIAAASSWRSLLISWRAARGS